MSSEDLIVVITGASRGFGRALAVVAAGSFQENTNLKIILVARSMEGLNTTAQHVRDQVGGSVNICCHSMDLGDLGHLDANFDKLCQEFETEAASSRRIIFIQNAGSIGHLGPCRDSPSLMAMQAYVDLNITSCLWTSARLAGYVKSAQIPTDMVIVSISSLVAIENFPTFGIYSAGKAARDKYHTLIAKEEAPEPSVTSSSTIRTLNYAPVSTTNNLLKSHCLSVDVAHPFFLSFVGTVGNGDGGRNPREFGSSGCIVTARLQAKGSGSNE